MPLGRRKNNITCILSLLLLLSLWSDRRKKTPQNHYILVYFSYLVFLCHVFQASLPGGQQRAFSHFLLWTTPNNIVMVVFYICLWAELFFTESELAKVEAEAPSRGQPVIFDIDSFSFSATVDGAMPGRRRRSGRPRCGLPRSFLSQRETG